MPLSLEEALAVAFTNDGSPNLEKPVEPQSVNEPDVLGKPALQDAADLVG